MVETRPNETMGLIPRRIAKKIPSRALKGRPRERGILASRYKRWRARPWRAMTKLTEFSFSVESVESFEVSSLPLRLLFTRERESATRIPCIMRRIRCSSNWQLYIIISRAFTDSYSRGYFPIHLLYSSIHHFRRVHQCNRVTFHKKRIEESEECKEANTRDRKVRRR